MTTPSTAPKVTILLHRWRDGDDGALEELMPLIYKEIYARARFILGKERRNHTISCTALVSEVYLKLVKEQDRKWQSRAHFFAVAARIMRNFLNNYAQARNAQKRGRGNLVFTMENLDQLEGPATQNLQALHEGINRLEKHDPKKVRILEMRFFVGMTIKEIAETMKISPATVKRELSFSKAWLNKFLRNS